MFRLKPDQTTFYKIAVLEGLIFSFLIFYTHTSGLSQLVDVSSAMGLESNHLGGFLGTGISFVDFNNDGYDDVTLGHHQGDIRFYQGNGEGFTQLTLANKRELNVAVICGDNEFNEGTVTIKNLKGIKGENNKTFPKSNLIDEIKKLI